MTDMSKPFREHPENLPPDVAVYRVHSATAVVPIVRVVVSNAIRASKPTITDREWFIKASEIFKCWPIIFDCPAELAFHNRTLTERFHDVKDCYLIQLATPIKDSWSAKEIIGFVLFAQDLYVYR